MEEEGWDGSGCWLRMCEVLLREGEYISGMDGLRGGIIGGLLWMLFLSIALLSALPLLFSLPPPLSRY